MTISKDKAMKKAVEILSAEIKNCLELVDNIKGITYGINENEIKNCWIFVVKPENFHLDGVQRYIIVNKKTGEVKEIITS